MSEQEKEHIEDLIGKYILNEATQQEKAEVEAWAQLNSENEKYLKDSQLIFEKSQIPSSPKFNADKAWEKVHPQLDIPGKRHVFMQPFWRVAAGLVLIASLAYIFYTQLNFVEEQVFISQNEVVTQIFEEEAEVTLNKDSEVKVAFNSRKKTGVIDLKGEATISISEDKKASWLVEAGELKILDIGTVFHVRAIPEEDHVEVSVFEGSVQFFTDEQEGILLESGEKGRFDKATQQFFKDEANPNVIAYKTRIFEFEDLPLQEVVDQLNQVYQQSIRLEGPIGNCPITVNFENESLETVLSIITETMGLDLDESGDEIVLSGESCF
ncbi:FecR family protein [Algoriphagus zhangzhouensis]|uniref:FecR family protein n=1 Tax=Algoriphagus zhangzhouensis TaxID=1073327 RepID=A0A1M7ZIQ1_9BACT|nr:FecR domain-containing protein [Algoriphagus zhangzhouensis]TDY44322.1 FecR family protein [Algoriphagus zhangzhouensis]SHO64556.1 FecR family protein [Algoriphagus zhangzhouensis]